MASKTVQKRRVFFASFFDAIFGPTFNRKEAADHEGRRRVAAVVRRSSGSSSLLTRQLTMSKAFSMHAPRQVLLQSDMVVLG